MRRWTVWRTNRREGLSNWLFLGVSFLVWASVALRWVAEFIEQAHPLTGLVTGLLLGYALLLTVEPRLRRASVGWRHVYLALQTILVLAAVMLYYELDFFALLLLPLAGQAMLLFERRTAMLWVGVLALVNLAGQIQQFGWPRALPFILLYTGALVFVAAFSIITQEAERARRSSESLLAELQAAHEQLQAYAHQAEELAVANERNRLARELHDSVAQTLYGLTLQAEAASRQLGAGQAQLVEKYLAQIKDSGQETLQEIRLLIFELSPPVLEQEGLAAALQARLEAVERRSGLQLQVQLGQVERLPLAVETSLYRLALEALNNALKHARAQQVGLQLAQEDGLVRLQVWDDGCGFDAQQVQGGMGLTSMQARADEIGGQLWIESDPGSGTRVRVEVKP